jgi:hypothetical protein
MPGSSEAAGRGGTTPPENPDETTRAVALGHLVAAGTELFPRGTLVRITRIQGSGGGGRVGVCGSGVLLADLALGSPLRVASPGMEHRPALVSSAVRSIERLGEDAVRVGTGNSVYRLERSYEASPGPQAAAPDPPAPGPPERSGRPAMADEVAVLGAGLGRAPAPDPSEHFRAGTRVRISRVKAGEENTTPLEDLGPGRLLDVLAEGQPFRLSVDEGWAFATTSVRRCRALGTDLIEVQTANTTYRLERIATPDGSAAGGSR